jgi:hypothetical protein
MSAVTPGAEYKRSINASFMSHPTEAARYSQIDTDVSAMIPADVRMRISEIFAGHEGLTQLVAEVMYDVGLAFATETPRGSWDHTLETVANYNGLMRARESTIPADNVELNIAQGLVVQNVFDDLFSLRPDRSGGNIEIKRVKGRRVSEPIRTELESRHLNLITMARPSTETVDQDGNLNEHFRAELRGEIQEAALLDHLFQRLPEFIAQFPTGVANRINTSVNTLKDPGSGGNWIGSILEELQQATENPDGTRNVRGVNIDANLWYDAVQALTVINAGVDPASGNVNHLLQYEELTGRLVVDGSDRERPGALQRYRDRHQAFIEERNDALPSPRRDPGWVEGLEGAHISLKVLENLIDPANKDSDVTEEEEVIVIPSDAGVERGVEIVAQHDDHEREKLALEGYQASDARNNFVIHVQTNRDVIGVDSSATPPNRVNAARRYLAGLQSTEQITRVIDSIIKPINGFDEMKRPFAGNLKDTARNAFLNFVTRDAVNRPVGSVSSHRSVGRRACDFQKATYRGYQELQRLANILDLRGNTVVQEALSEYRDRIGNPDQVEDVEAFDSNPSRMVTATHGLDPQQRNELIEDQGAFEPVSEIRGRRADLEQSFLEALGGHQTLIKEYIKQPITNREDIERLLRLAEIIGKAGGNESSRIQGLGVAIVDKLIGNNPGAHNPEHRTVDEVDELALFPADMRRIAKIIGEYGENLPVGIPITDQRMLGYNRIKNIYQTEIRRLASIGGQRWRNLVNEFSGAKDAFDRLGVYLGSETYNALMSIEQAAIQTVGTGIDVTIKAVGLVKRLIQATRRGGSKVVRGLSSGVGNSYETVMGGVNTVKDTALGGASRVRAEFTRRVDPMGMVRRVVRDARAFRERGVRSAEAARQRNTRDQEAARILDRRRAEQEAFDAKRELFNLEYSNRLFTLLMDSTNAGLTIGATNVTDATGATLLNVNPNNWNHCVKQLLNDMSANPGNWTHLAGLRETRGGLPATDAEALAIVEDVDVSDLVRHQFEDVSDIGRLNDRLRALGSLDMAQRFNPPNTPDPDEYTGAIVEAYIPAAIEVLKRQSTAYADSSEEQNMAMIQDAIDRLKNNLDTMEASATSPDLQNLIQTANPTAAPPVPNGLLRDRLEEIETLVQASTNETAFFTAVQGGAANMTIQTLHNNAGDYISRRVQIDISDPTIAASIRALDTDGDGYISGADLLDNSGLVGGPIPVTSVIPLNSLHIPQGDELNDSIGLMGDRESNSIRNLGLEKWFRRQDEKFTRKVMPAIRVMAGRNESGEAVGGLGRVVTQSLRVLPFGQVLVPFVERATGAFVDWRGQALESESTEMGRIRRFGTNFKINAKALAKNVAAIGGGVIGTATNGMSETLWYSAKAANTLIRNPETGRLRSLAPNLAIAALTLGIGMEARRIAGDGAVNLLGAAKDGLVERYTRFAASQALNALIGSIRRNRQVRKIQDAVNRGDNAAAERARHQAELAHATTGVLSGAMAAFALGRNPDGSSDPFAEWLEDKAEEAGQSVEEAINELAGGRDVVGELEDTFPVIPWLADRLDFAGEEIGTHLRALADEADTGSGMVRGISEAFDSAKGSVSSGLGELTNGVGSFIHELVGGDWGIFGDRDGDTVKNIFDFAPDDASWGIFGHDTDGDGINEFEDAQKAAARNLKGLNDALVNIAGGVGNIINNLGGGAPGGGSSGGSGGGGIQPPGGGSPGGSGGGGIQPPGGGSPGGSGGGGIQPPGGGSSGGSGGGTQPPQQPQQPVANLSGGWIDVDGDGTPDGLDLNGDGVIDQNISFTSSSVPRGGHGGNVELDSFITDSDLHNQMGDNRLHIAEILLEDFNSDLRTAFNHDPGPFSSFSEYVNAAAMIAHDRRLFSSSGIQSDLSKIIADLDAVSDTDPVAANVKGQLFTGITEDRTKWGGMVTNAIESYLSSSGVGSSPGAVDYEFSIDGDKVANNSELDQYLTRGIELGYDVTDQNQLKSYYNDHPPGTSVFASQGRGMSLGDIGISASTSAETGLSLDFGDIFETYVTRIDNNNSMMHVNFPWMNESLEIQMNPTLATVLSYPVPGVVSIGLLGATTAVTKLAAFGLNAVGSGAYKLANALSFGLLDRLFKRD